MKSDYTPKIYSQMQKFADVTSALIMFGNIDRAKRCLKAAEDLYNTGSTEIKFVVTNVYLASVATFMELHNCSIRNLLPKSLQNEYYKQVNAARL